MEHIVPIDKFGRDHWGTLLYIESCAVDKGGKLDDRRMRTKVYGKEWKYGTILNDDTKIEMHDDWDCLTDFRAAGIIEDNSKSSKEVKLTDFGWNLAHQLRRRRAKGLPDADFRVLIIKETSK